VDVVAYNSAAWDREVEKGNPWTLPVGPDVIADAKRGEWSVLLTPTRPVPKSWFPRMWGADVLCLASGGGQQGPIFAAAGARVIVLDNSLRQLAQDRAVAEREGLEIATVLGQMADLSAFEDASFDLVFHPVSNLFAPAVRPVWREAYRVLRRGGALLAGFMNPAIYLFDLELADEQRVLEVRHTLPYSDLEDAPEELRRRYIEAGEPLEFSHSLEDQIGGQTDAGFLIAGLYEDGRPPEMNDVVSRHLPVCIVHDTDIPEILSQQSEILSGESKTVNVLAIGNDQGSLRAPPRRLHR
jgi:SAM-dependent methyltransferase